jgi:hypothetical protein
MVSFLRSPLAASLPALPPPQAGDSRPTFDVGYTSVSHAPRRSFSLPLPALDGRPVLEVKDVRWVRLARLRSCEATPPGPRRASPLAWWVRPEIGVDQSHLPLLLAVAVLPV